MTSGPYDYDYEDYVNDRMAEDDDFRHEQEINENPDWFGSTDESVSEYWDHED
jgi:hypothetical protein